jgi:AcrR family transcriptional regulator
MNTTEQIGLRRPGRPRDEKAHDVIIHAALESFVEDGLDAASMEGIAFRAGVGKATIYRRWHSKEELISEAIGCCAQSLVTPDTGSARGDLVELMRRLQSDLSGSIGGQIFPRMVGEVWNGTPFGEVFAQTAMRPRRQALIDALERGIARGELREGLDTELAADALTGAVIVGRMLAGVGAQRPPESTEQVVDLILRGLLAPPP